VKRVKTGIPGLDELIEGGFPEGASILVSGGPGTGKSIFCMQYLYAGAKDYGDPGLYATLEEGPHNLWWNMQRFNWDLLSLEKENKLKIIKFDPDLSNRENLEEQVLQIVDKAKEIGARRLVIDSITAFSFWVKDVSSIRFAMYLLIEKLRSLKCTTVLTCETSGGRTELSRFGVEEFLVDGVIQLFFIPPHRSVFVRKMRGTNNNKYIHPVEITEQGISIKSKEELLWESIKE